MWRCLWLGGLGIIGSFLLMGWARSEEKPKGKPPLTMTIARVAKDHLVVEHVAPVPDDPLAFSTRTYRPAFKSLRVFDRDGKPVAEADWKKHLKPGLKVYVAADEKKVDPTHLRTAPKDALVLWGVVVLTPEPLEP
jgi:hypothetical protein